DEPTAQLDVRGETEIFERLLEATRGCTTILVSHRFSTVRRADRICVLEGGRVIELGSHDELMALGGRYRSMFDLQAARFAEGEGAARGARRCPARPGALAVARAAPGPPCRATPPRAVVPPRGRRLDPAVAERAVAAVRGRRAPAGPQRPAPSRD